MSAAVSADPSPAMPAQRVTLKKTGGSLTVTVPARARDALRLAEGQEMTVSVEGRRLIFEPARPRPHYRLEDLLAQCDGGRPPTEETRAWAEAEPVGNEVW